MATASTNRPAFLWTAPALPVNLAGMGPTAISHALWDSMGRTVPSLVPAASKGRLVTRRRGNAGTVNQASLVTGGDKASLSKVCTDTGPGCSRLTPEPLLHPAFMTSGSMPLPHPHQHASLCCPFSTSLLLLLIPCIPKGRLEWALEEVEKKGGLALKK